MTVIKSAKKLYICHSGILDWMINISPNEEYFPMEKMNKVVFSFKGFLRTIHVKNEIQKFFLSFYVRRNMNLGIFSPKKLCRSFNNSKG